VIAVEPSCAGADLQAIEKIVYLIIFDVKRMSMAKEIVSEHVPIC